MKTHVVRVNTHRLRKVSWERARDPEAALNKVQRAPKGQHWEECTCRITLSNLFWTASVSVEGKEYFYHLQDNG